MKKTDIYINYRKVFRLIALIALNFVCTISIYAEGDRFAKEKDSLQHFLDVHSKPRIILPVLARLSDLYMQTPEEIKLLERQVDLAFQIDSVPAVYAALGKLTRYYYNEGKYDSLIFWGNKIDSLAKLRKEYPRELFDFKGLSCQDLLWKGNYEMAMNDAMQLYQLANDTKQVYGLVRASEALGQIFQAMRRDSDAVKSFEEGLSLMETIGGDLETQIRLTSYQAESSLRTGNWQQTHFILARYKHYIDQQAELNRQKGEVYEVERDYWLFYCFYTDLYLHENKLKEAGKMLSEAAKYAGNIIVEGDYAGRVYLATQARYYKKTGNIALSLQVLDSLLVQERIPEDLQLKADILKEQGRKKEALTLYDEIYTYISKRSDETFLRQLGQLQLLHEIHNQEMQTKELQIASQRMQQKQNQLFLSGVVLLILVIFLYVLYAYYRRVRRLSKELLYDKQLLLESEKKLIKEKEKAEDASRMKSAFLANMSHEIRTPMNAIVGFSELLADTSASSDEKKEYASVIHNNTDLLLNLLNDVLDLTRMEMGDMQFKFTNCSLEDCCRRSLDSVRRRVPEGVKLTFSPAAEPVILYTDPLRLQQLLLNLLGNASKFTREGEINLSYEIDEDGKQVRISVTDTGVGIPLEKQKTIFNRFERLDDYKPGVGLGLSISSIIAERLGGSIFVDSTYTKGARFVFIHSYNSK